MIYNFDDFSFQILNIDLFLHKKGSFRVKARPYASLSYRTKGTGCFEIGNKHLVTNPGDLLFIPANQPYLVDYSVSESIVIHFQQCNYREAESITPKNSAPIGIGFQRLLESWSKERSVNLAKSIIYEVLERIGQDQKSLIEDTVFTRCMRYMEAHFCEAELDIAKVCKTCFISPSGLQRAFDEHLGLSPKQYLQKLRMNRALLLLAENRLSVKEIAFACGFRDEKYFSRAFKKSYGYPPSQMQSNMLV